MQIDTEKLTAEVAKRKCLWDTSEEDYKFREAKQKAWEEVADAIFDDFRNRNAEDKDEMIAKVQQRWKNARDNYNRVRLANKKSECDTGKKIIRTKYAYYKQLQFLDKLDTPETNKRFDVESYERSVKSNPTSNPISQKTYSANQASTHEKSKCQDAENRSHLLEMINETSIKMNDTDVLFFNSMLPMVRTLSNSDKLLFRHKVIQELLNIKINKNNNMSGSSNPICNKSFKFSAVCVPSNFPRPDNKPI